MVALLACGGDSLGTCRSLMEREQYDEAAVQCTGVFERTGLGEAAVLAARASRALGDEAAVLAWAPRLRGTTEEPALLSVIAGHHRRQGQVDQAIEAYRLQIEAARQLADVEQEAWGVYGLYYLAWERSDFQAALLEADRMLEVAARSGEPRLVATSVQALFNLQYDLGDLEGAGTTLDRAESLVDPSDVALQARQWNYRCALELDRGRQHLAIQACRRALEIAPTDLGRSFWRSTHLNLVRAHLELGDSTSAAPHLADAWTFREPDGSRTTGLWYHRAWLALTEGRPQEALPDLEAALAEEPSADWAWDLEALLGSAAFESGEPGRAEAAWSRAIETLEALRQDLGSDELKPWLLTKRRRPFEDLFTLRAEAGRWREALAVTERARARDLLDAFISATNAASGSPVPTDSEWIGPSERTAAERHRTLGTLLPSLQASPLAASRAIDELLAELTTEPVLLFFWARDVLWSALLVEGRSEIRRVEADGPILADLVTRFVRQPGDPELATRLGELLIPSEALITPHLTLVTEGDLSAIPFAALRVGETFLVERISLSQVPSLEALVALAETEVEAGAPPKIFGDPLGDLPAAGQEARAAAEMLGGHLALGAEASIEALWSGTTPSLLHLASHSGVDSRGPWVALADGVLTASDVLAGPQAPPLVVLASCASGARARRGVWGSLGAAFLAAGSRAVVVSLWSVDDAASQRFIERFYVEGGARDPAGALARAQRAMLASGEPAEAWAAFALIGLHHVPSTPQRGTTHAL